MTLRADILVVASGKGEFITGDMIKEGAVVIDVGMNRNSAGKLVGDVHFESCLLYTSNNRDTAAYARFEQVVDVLLARNAQQLRPVRCDKLFVARYHAFARQQRRLCEAVRRFQPANRLYNDADGCIV